MNTECNAKELEFHTLGRRRVVANFDGGTISSDSGGILLREVEQQTQMLKRLAGCFVDYRDPNRIEHSVESLIKQRVMGLALGYEDLNDHDTLRSDPLLAVLCDADDVTGAERVREQDQGAALAGKSTLNRLELAAADEDPADSRYRKIEADPAAMDTLLVDLFLDSYAEPPEQIILDADATDDPLHGTQEGRFFHGYYDHYCYLPLYIFCGEHLLCARLRPANIDGAEGTLDELQNIVARIRTRWPETQIMLRGDSGFCRDAIMAWCEANNVDYIVGLAKNSRLKTELAPAMADAKQQHETSGEPALTFTEFAYRTCDSWSRQRRVIGKAEYLAKGENPRFIVTSLNDGEPQTLYEQLYCARGEMENRIKEQQLALFADRTSTHEMRANQLRLYLASFAYVLIQTLRRIGLAGTAMAKARCDTIRLKLFKIGAQIRVSVRRIYIALSDSCPEHNLFGQVLDNLRRRPVRC